MADSVKSSKTESVTAETEPGETVKPTASEHAHECSAFTCHWHTAE
jgi:hypothetical protein